MNLRRQRGQVLAEYTLVCLLLCIALLWPYEEGKALPSLLAEALVQFCRNVLWLVSID